MVLISSFARDGSPLFTAWGVESTPNSSDSKFTSMSMAVCKRDGSSGGSFHNYWLLTRHNIWNEVEKC